MLSLHFRKLNIDTDIYAKHALGRAMSLDVKEMGFVPARNESDIFLKKNETVNSLMKKNEVFQSDIINVHDFVALCRGTNFSTDRHNTFWQHGPI